MSAKYSFVIPYFNGSKYIEETIDSIILQTYDNFEVIIINDSSSVSERQKLISTILSKNDDRLTVYHNKENVGLMASLNTAIYQASSDYIILLGQDDVVDVNHLKEINNFVLAGCDFSVLFCDAYYISGDIDTNKKVRGSKLDKFTDNKIPFISLMKWNYVVSTGVCINKADLNKIGGFATEFKNYGEWLTWLKLSSVGNIYINRKAFSKYRRHDSNITNDMFDSKFKETYRYYQYANLFALKLKPRFSTLFVFVINYFKNISLLMYKKIIKSSNAHTGVYKK